MHRLCDFKRACDVELPETSSLKVDVHRVIATTARMFERTGESRHLDYEKAFEREIRKKAARTPRSAGIITLRIPLKKATSSHASGSCRVAVRGV